MTKRPPLAAAAALFLIPTFLSSIALAAATSGSSNRASSPGTVCSAACGCGVSAIPLGVVPPAGGFQTGCDHLYVIKPGSGNSPSGTWTFLEFQPCDNGPCGSMNGESRIRCEIANGPGCRFDIGDVVETVPGTKTSIMQGIADRFARDTDQRSPTCYAAYWGNGARVVVMPELAPFDTNGRKAAQLTRFAVFYLRNLPVRPDDDLIGEFLEYIVPGH